MIWVRRFAMAAYFLFIGCALASAILGRYDVAALYAVAALHFDRLFRDVRRDHGS